MKGTKDQSAQKALKAPRAHQNKHPRTSIRPMLNILKNSPDGRHTLIIQPDPRTKTRGYLHVLPAAARRVRQETGPRGISHQAPRPDSLYPGG